MRSLQIHPALWCITTLLKCIKVPPFRTSTVDEHPRRGFTPVDTPGPSASTFAHVLHDGRYKVGESARRGSFCLRSVRLSMATSPRSPRHAPVHVMLMLHTRVTVRCACARRSREEQLLICFARRHGLSGAAARL